jgi:rhodanese-related sulfurtransferase
MKTISPGELRALLASHPDLLLLDVRTPVEFAEVHVARARNEPLDSLDPRALLGSGILPTDRAIHLICRTGSRATKAAEAFAKAGHADVVVVAGGTQGWIEAGLPVERGTVRAISLERQVRIAAGSLVFTGVILGWRIHPGFYGLSGFVGAGLVFAGITDYCGMGLLLARAPWNRTKPANP